MGLHSLMYCQSERYFGRSEFISTSSPKEKWLLYFILSLLAGVMFLYTYPCGISRGKKGGEGIKGSLYTRGESQPCPREELMGRGTRGVFIPQLQPGVPLPSLSLPIESVVAWQHNLVTCRSGFRSC